MAREMNTSTSPQHAVFKSFVRRVFLNRLVALACFLVFQSATPGLRNLRAACHMRWVLRASLDPFLDNNFCTRESNFSMNAHSNNCEHPPYNDRHKLQHSG